MRIQAGPTGSVRSVVLAAVAAIAIPASLFAAQAAPAPAAAQADATPNAEHPKVSITAGRSTVLATDFDITRIAVTNPAIADAVVVQPREILIDGKAPGVISPSWGHTARPA
jgi:pilus assembly protein CpaC